MKIVVGMRTLRMALLPRHLSCAPYRRVSRGPVHVALLELPSLIAGSLYLWATLPISFPFPTPPHLVTTSLVSFSVSLVWSFFVFVSVFLFLASTHK